MIYNMSTNKMHSSMNEISIKDYDFYREGCLVNASKLADNFAKLSK